MPSSSFLYMPSSAEYRKSLVYFWNIERIYDFTPLINHLWGKKKVATIAVKISNKYFKEVVEAKSPILICNISLEER